jgi:hypothetical protein
MLKRVTALAVFLSICSCVLLAQSWYNINESTAADDGTVGWGSCVACAGGGTTGTVSSAPNQTYPSLDGRSRDFIVSGADYTDGLWWYKVGPHDSDTHFTFEFWLQVGSGSRFAQALEFDVFQFRSGVEYMFGTQCDYANGVWQLWNAGMEEWVPTQFACKRLTPGKWYHLTYHFHRTVPDNAEHYDSLTIGEQHESTTTYNFATTYPSGTLPRGFTENMGAQFQIDIGASGGTIEEWVDEVNFIAN